MGTVATKTAPALAPRLKVLSDDPERAGLIWQRPTEVPISQGGFPERAAS